MAFRYDASVITTGVFYYDDPQGFPTTPPGTGATIEWLQPLSPPADDYRVTIVGGAVLVELIPDDLLPMWFRPLSDPVRRSPHLPRALVQFHVANVAPITQAESVTLDKWYQPLAMPVVRARPPLPPGSILSVTVPTPVEYIWPSHWFMPLAQPVRRPRWTPDAVRPAFPWRPSVEPTSVEMRMSIESPGQGAGALSLGTGISAGTQTQSGPGLQLGAGLSTQQKP